jgi:hypothetical protein
MNVFTTILIKWDNLREIQIIYRGALSFINQPFCISVRLLLSQVCPPPATHPSALPHPTKTSCSVSPRAQTEVRTAYTRPVWTDATNYIITSLETAAKKYQESHLP